MENAIQKLDLRRPAKTASLSAEYGRHYRRAGASIQGSLSNWATSLITSAMAEREKRKVSDRSWDLYLNDALGYGVLEGIVTQCVNIGLTPKPEPMYNWLKLSPEWATSYQETAFSAYEIWGLDPRNYCEWTRRMNAYMLQALMFFQWKLEGLGIGQIGFRDIPGAPFSLSVMPIDPGRLVTPRDATISEDIYDGIKLGPNGPEAAYILKADRLRRQYGARKDDCDFVKIFDDKTGLPLLLLVCNVRNVAEWRQDSILSPAIKEIKDNGDLVDAALIKTVISNLWTLFLESEQEAGILNARFGGQTQNPGPSTWEERLIELEKGTMIVGKKGERPTFLDSNAPGPGYEIMYNSILGRLGMVSGRGPENITKSYKASYSASMANIEDAGKTDDSDRMVLVNRFCQPVFMWLQYELAMRGVLDVKSVDHFRENLFQYTRTDWLPPPARPIDHWKAAKANTEQLSNNSKTYADIFGEQSADWRPKLRQRAIEKAYILELEKEFPGISMQDGKSSGDIPPDQEGDR